VLQRGVRVRDHADADLEERARVVPAGLLLLRPPDDAADGQDAVASASDGGADPRQPGPHELLLGQHQRDRQRKDQEFPADEDAERDPQKGQAGGIVLQEPFHLSVPERFAAPGDPDSAGDSPASPAHSARTGFRRRPRGFCFSHGVLRKVGEPEQQPAPDVTRAERNPDVTPQRQSHLVSMVLGDLYECAALRDRCGLRILRPGGLGISSEPPICACGLAMRPAGSLMWFRENPTGQ